MYRSHFTNILTITCLALCAGAALGQSGDTLPPNVIWVSSLDLSKMTTGYGTPVPDKSIDGNAISLKGVKYVHGVGTHAVSELDINLSGQAKEFTATVGVDDEKSSSGSVGFVVLVDGVQKFKSPVLHGGDTPALVDVDLTGAKLLTLDVNDGGDGISSDHADWADAEITLASSSSTSPIAIAIVPPVGRMVVPPVSPIPAIHGARVVGSTPGHPFLYKIAATGAGPLTYSAKNLPAGLLLDPATGIISGSLIKTGAFTAMLVVHGPSGVATRSLYIVGAAHKLALTPPMGWCSWDAYSGGVNADNVKATANAMVSSGLIDHGYQYINVDDTWEAGRDSSGNIQTNGKFPDMAGTIAYIHSLGLKFGIYSSPGPTTCGGYTASYGHESQDALSYANWGVDYLKYDYCSYSQIAKGDTTVPTLEKPYAQMGAALAATNRDIVFAFCEYGMGDPWKWGPDAGGNVWRVNQDLTDDWNDPQGGAGWTPGSLRVLIDQMADIDQYTTPGHWNDPDQLAVGWFDWGSSRPVHFSQNEQILMFTMWSMSSAPLLIGSDITRLDPFTTALLSNDEVIDIDQDPLGRGAARVTTDGLLSVWMKPLFDGTKAVALVNEDSLPASITVHWPDIGVAGSQPLRDLWLHRNLGNFIGSYTVETPAHGVVLLKVGRPLR